MEDNILKIETISDQNNNLVSFCSKRGGIITSLILNGKEILYLDEETFSNREVNVRGGIPILFPNAGPININSEFPNLQQHGFARKSEWKSEKINNGFNVILESNIEMRKVYPYEFKLSVSGLLEEDGSFTINQEIENLEQERGLPISMGLHPYFKVPNNEKNNIKFDFIGGKFIEEQIELWANGEYVSIDNPKLKDPNAIMKVVIPSLGTLTIEASVEYKKIWIWSIPGKDFICIEPVMRDMNGLIDNPEILQPNGTYMASVNLKLGK